MLNRFVGVGTGDPLETVYQVPNEYGHGNAIYLGGLSEDQTHAEEVCGMSVT